MLRKGPLDSYSSVLAGGVMCWPYGLPAKARGQVLDIIVLRFIQEQVE